MRKSSKEYLNMVSLFAFIKRLPSFKEMTFCFQQGNWNDIKTAPINDFLFVLIKIIINCT